MTRKKPASRKYKKTQAARLAWPWRAAAGLFWLFSLFLVSALLSYSAADPTPLNPDLSPVRNTLGLAGAMAAALAYDSCGLAVWWLVLLGPLAGYLLWSQRNARPLVLVAGGGVWLVIATAAMLGLTAGTANLGGGEVPLGGRGGSAMALNLILLFPMALAWAISLLAAALGLALAGWAAWPLIGPFLEPYLFQNSQDGEEEDSGPVIANSAGQAEEEEVEKEPSPPPPPVPPAPPEPKEPESGQDGPRIRPRTPRVKPAADKPASKSGSYEFPGLELLQEPEDQRPPDQAESLRLNSRLLEEKLKDFNVQGKVVEVAPGPVVTMYEFQPAPGVKISKVSGLSDDLAMNLKATAIRIVAPIPGKAVIGIEIPNQRRETVYLREILASSAYQKAKSPLSVALGKDILGAPVVTDLGHMPHLLIAGATGSGKSVFINTLVLSILHKALPEQVRLLMVDPKRIELATYGDIPHLLYPIISNPQEATAGLRWAVAEMERRYELLARMGVRNIASFNKKLKAGGWPVLPDDDPHEAPPEPLPYIVVIIDELADLMMVSSKEVEALITRLAQMARAAGIHLVLATQRPSVDVITGLIKANFPARISFQVASRVDSRTILDQQGAENLLGRGDMLFVPPGTAGVRRLHGAFVSDREIEAVAGFVKKQGRPEYDESIVQTAPGDGNGGLDGGEIDERYADAVALVRQTGRASASYIQRRLRVGYNRAARMVEQMEADGIVGPSEGSKPREVLYHE